MDNGASPLLKVIEHAFRAQNGASRQTWSDLRRSWCQISLPLMGICAVHGGVITAWRDYFDLHQLDAGAGG
ncbi:MAG TPA: limonene-1,2-epoxide hydrolase family protein [Acidimicrobiales bacterium]|nr:limonene-1,2-epoxide hydrolase family protein [Acidimicrobiales bacterium]